MSDYRVIWVRKDETCSSSDQLLVMSTSVAPNGELVSVHVNDAHRDGFEQGHHEHGGIELHRDAIPALITALAAELPSIVREGLAAKLCEPKAGEVRTMFGLMDHPLGDTHAR